MTTSTLAYVIGSTEIVDPAPLAGYVQQVPATVERFGGRIRLAGPVTALEGDAPTIAAVIEFPDAVAAASWYDSADYAAIRKLRHASGESRVWLVEAAPDAPDDPAGLPPADHPNIALARRGYDAFARGDLPALLDLLAEDIVWHINGDGPLSGALQGIDAVTGLFARMAEITGGTQHLTVRHLFADDDHVVAVVHETATRARDGARLDWHATHVMRVRDGKVVEVRDLVDDPRAVDAFFG